jgi:hypothetical protein
MSLDLSPTQIEHIKRNSYKNFHVKGLDYLCLDRTEALTLKAYFFDGDCDQLPELVIPHDHRYDFRSMVLAGQVANITFERTGRGSVYERFAYHTPLNGGGGFTHVGQTRLGVQGTAHYSPGEVYYSPAEQIHTLRITAPQSVLLIWQFEDRLPLDQPTSSYRLGDKEPPSLDGLYDRLTPDEAISRYQQAADLFTAVTGRPGRTMATRTAAG